MKEASIKKITTKSNLIDWLDTIPEKISLTTFKIILKKSQHHRFILWRRGLGFKFFK